MVVLLVSSLTMGIFLGLECSPSTSLLWKNVRMIAKRRVPFVNRFHIARLTTLVN